jgi:phosphomannomutase
LSPNVRLAFDGDADRVFFIDELGRRISASLIGAMVAKQVLQDNPEATIIYNAVCSRIVPETITNNGGKAVMERVGHSYIKKTMKETGAVFAAEHSGHYYFLDNYRADSGLIAALIVLQMISQKGKPFSEVLHEFETYSAIEETNSQVTDKAAAVARVKAAYPDAEVLEFDGTTFTYPDFWFNVRPSNTEPVLRLNLEARTPELRDQKTAEILNLIRQ